MIVACFAPAAFLIGLALGGATLGVCLDAYGRCRRCGVFRKPKCDCPGGSPQDPEVRKPNWTIRPRK